MRRLLLALGFVVSLISPAVAEPTAVYDRYDQLLARYVTESRDGINRVDYARWAGAAADRAALDAVVSDLAKERPSSMPRSEAFAYWANLYNAITLKVILDNHPVASIRNIRSKGVGLNPKGLIGPWVEKRVTVEGRELTLDNIEHDIMRPTFRDPRVHYAVNCASIGCPNLKPTAWRAASLEPDLTAAARAYVNHPRGVTVDDRGRVTASTIYRWFQEDFGGSEAGVLSHLRQYANPELAKKLEGKTDIADFAYDWALNGA